MTRKTSLLILLLFFIVQGFSQNHRYLFNSKKKITQYLIDSWNQKSGLPTNSLNDIYQSKKGFIWIASYSGLIRFNGLDFQIFNKSNTPTFKENGIIRITGDKDTTLWIATQTSGLVSYKNGRFTSYFDSLSQLSGLLFVDNNNNLWFETIKQKVYYYDHQTLHYVQLLTRKKVVKMVQDKDGYYWAATAGNGLIRFKDTTKIDIFTRKDGLPSGWINDIFIDKNNVLWIATDNGLAYYDSGFKIIPDFVKTGIFSIAEDFSENLWFGTTKGIFLYNKKDNNYQVLNHKNGLPFNFVLKLMIDKENSLWLLGYRKGLARVKDSKFTFIGNNEGFEGSLPNTLCEIDSNTILVGFNNGKIFQILDYNVTPFEVKSNLEDKRIRNIFKDSKKNLWISTYNGLLEILASGKEQWIQGLPDKYIRVVFEDKYNNIWIGTRNSGLVKIKPDGNREYINIKNGLKSNLIMSLNQDKEGNIIVGTSKGGLSIISNDSVVTTYTKDDGLTDNIIFKTYVDSENNIWVAAKGGLNLISKNKVYPIPAEDGLLLETPYDVLEDDSHNFWMPCSKGIMEVPKQQISDYLNGKISRLNVKIYTAKDGLKEPECNSTATNLKSNDGTLWFCTIDGVATIDPKNIPFNDILPNVFITQVNVDNKIYNPDSLKKITLLPNDKRLTLTFTATSYYSPESNLFSYKLEGFDENWSDSTNRNFVTYTNLKPGKYTFKVKACNSDGFWIQKPTELTIIVKPHFYQTAYFIILMVLLGFGIIFIIYRLRVASLKKRQEILEKMVEDRNKQLIEKNEELQKQNQEILAQSERIAEQAAELEKLSIVASETDNNVLIFDKDLKLMWKNIAFDKKFIAAEQTSIYDLFPSSETRKIIDESIEKNKSVTFTTKRKDKNGKTTWLQCNLNPILKDIHKEVVIVESDITKLKKIQIVLALKKKYITQSIEYAKSIQQAILPSLETINKFFEAFILYLPKDIVSGDFYWFSDITQEYKNTENYNKKIVQSSIFVLSDCTGHGVPGAFMSMLGVEMLNYVILYHKIFDPKKILEKINHDIQYLLKQDTTNNSEGMDMSVCLINRMSDNSVEITFAGAKQNLFFYNLQEKKLKRIKGDRKSIGGYHNRNFEFTNYSFVAQKNEILYFTSDGYIDQANPERKRFGTKRLMALIEKISNKTMHEQKEILTVSLNKWKQKELQRDDISIVGLKL